MASVLTAKRKDPPATIESLLEQVNEQSSPCRLKRQRTQVEVQTPSDCKSLRAVAQMLSSGKLAFSLYDSEKEFASQKEDNSSPVEEVEPSTMVMD